MTLPTLKLELDTTGVNPANKREYEPHVSPTRTTRVFKPNFGPYFTKSLKVWSVQGATRVPLNRGTDFTCVEFFAQTTQRLATEVCAAILIHRPDLPDQFEITYQALGGFQNIDFEGMAIAVRDLYAGGENVDWKDILDKPTAFPPSAHLHDSADLYGLEYLRDEIDNLANAIPLSNDYVEVLMLKEVQKSRDSIVTALRNYLAQIETHLLDKSNSHGLTKGQISMGSVENRHFYPVTRNSVVIEPYASPRTTFNLIKAAVLGDILKHIDDHNNPHQVTKTQIGLPLVMNYSLGTVQDILTGTLTTAYVTPALVSGAVPLLLGGILGHIADTNNPHQLTATQLGVQLISNFPFAVGTEVALGVTEERFMAPADVKTVLDNYVTEVTPSRLAHFNNTNDPHEVTALQVGLNLVANYDVAQGPAIVFGVVDDQYITPFELKDSLSTNYAGKLNTSQIDNAGGVVPLDALRRVPARLLDNVPDFRQHSVKGYFGTGLLADLQLFRYIFTRSITFPENFLGSVAAFFQGPLTDPVTIEILKGEDVRVGTITFQPSAEVGASASKVGTIVTPTASVQFLIGDVLTLRCSKADAAANQLAFHFIGTLDVSQTSNPTGQATMMPSLTPRPADYVLFTAGVDDSAVSVNTRDKWQIAGSTRTTTANTGAQRDYACGFGNSWKGYIAAGKLSDVAVNTFEEFRYSDETYNVVAGLNIGAARYEGIGFGNENMAIITGGITAADTFSTATTKFSYGTMTMSVVTSLGLAMARSHALSNGHAGYIRHGSTILLDTDGTTYYGKYTYSSQTLATVSTVSTLSRFGAAAAGNTSVGVITGGTNGGTAITTTQRINYATDALSAGTVLSDARSFSAGGGNAQKGIFGGGVRTTGIPVDTGTVYTYSDDTTITSTVLGTARQHHVALSSTPGWR